jgi:hypothetical protein
MKPDDFVDVLKSQCRDAAVAGCLSLFEHPPGRKPNAELLRVSQWFHTLKPADREVLKLALMDVADSTLFGVLCVIDGVRSVEDTNEKSEFTLTATRKGEHSQISPSGTFLHDLLRSKP